VLQSSLRSVDELMHIHRFLMHSIQLVLAPLTGPLGVTLAVPLLTATLGVVQILVPAKDALPPVDHQPNNLTSRPRNCTKTEPTRPSFR
jgi:hypothetical protein